MNFYCFLMNFAHSYSFICITFAEDKLHSAICKQAYIALVCIIFAEDKLHSAICKQAYITLVCIIFADENTNNL